MPFEEEKRRAKNNLHAAEKEGDLDAELMPLLSAINELPDYYTTSSCSGRVVLMQSLGGKGVDRFLAKWHRRASPGEVLAAIRPCEGTVWFRYESPILHVMARTPEKAAEFLHACREAGFKRSGIQSLKAGRNLVEALSTERIDAPVMSDGAMAATEEYVRYLVGQAGLKYEAGRRKLERLSEAVAGLR
jgi:tRNA wybutosine-synthesizing protein 3